MADENAVLMYKGHPLMRKDNLIYYGSMADSHIVMLQVLETKKVNDLDVATRVSVQLQLTDPTARSRDRIVKKSEKDGLYTAPSARRGACRRPTCRSPRWWPRRGRTRCTSRAARRDARGFRGRRLSCR